MKVKQVAVWPSPWNNQLANKMFDSGYGPGRAYINAFRLWREMASAAGFELNTWDKTDVSCADVLWFIDLPRRRSDFISAKQLASRAKTILMVCESPLICPQMFFPAHRAECDLVVSYEPPSGEVLNSLNYKLPVDLETSVDGPEFEHRRLLCVVNSNRVEGFFAVRQTGLEGLPGIGRLFGGWRLGPSAYLRPAAGELYSARRRLALAADLKPHLAVDFYGKGWHGQQISWCPVYPKRKYGCAREAFVADRLGKLSQYKFSLAYENWRGSKGYITDRIFDGFLAGAVPVYLGDESIKEVFPKESFVDARDFATEADLLDHLSKMSKSRWLEMQECGRSFLASDAARLYGNDAFAQIMVRALQTV